MAYKSFKYIHKCFILFGVAIFLHLPYAQGEAELPARISLPWKFLNYPKQFQAQNKIILAESLQQWNKNFITTPKTLLAATREKGITTILNLELLAKSIIVGEVSPNLPAPFPISSQPILCSLGTHSLVFLTLTHATKDYLISSGHHILPSSEVLNKSPQELLPIINRALLQAGDRAVKKFREDIDNKNDSLQISLRALRQFTRKDHGSSLCLNLLLSERLAEKNFQVVRNIGLETLQILRRIYGKQDKTTRATRSFALKWTMPEAETINFPLRLNLNISSAEAVFGDSITKVLDQGQLEFSITNQNNLDFPFPPELLNFLEQEQASLAYQSPPKISKIYGAWVYVDKGRAWGLRMKDRLVFGSSGEIKGHVIGFFGPELQLKSPSGYDINEGAIVFIRKGQRKVKLGLEASYDSRTFPTPWPPSKNN
jgi:hypothetical protein